MVKSNIYVGIDLHKQNFTVVMMDQSGKVMTETSGSTEAGNVAAFGSRLTGRHQVVLEPVENSHWFVRQLEPYAGSVHMANTGKVRLIAESRLKSDRIDARILADLLRVGYLPEVYIPEDEVYLWRGIIQHRIRLVRDRTRLKCRILGLLNREGSRIAASDPFGKKGRAEIDAAQVSAALRAMIDSYVVAVDLLSAQVHDLDKQIEQIVYSDSIAMNLMTIDGVACFTALAIRAIIGRIDRFRDVKAFAAYTGLIPGYRQSADRVTPTGITKQGSSTLRWVLMQAAGHAVCKNAYLRRLHRRICYRSTKANARTAVAHALAIIIYHVWKEARPYYR